jgi:hypothetical protein
VGLQTETRAFSDGNWLHSLLSHDTAFAYTTTLAMLALWDVDSSAALSAYEGYVLMLSCCM